MSQDAGESQNQTLPLQKLSIAKGLIFAIVVPQHLLKRSSIAPQLVHLHDIKLYDIRMISGTS
jgi:hypothetical protein